MVLFTIKLHIMEKTHLTVCIKTLGILLPGMGMLVPIFTMDMQNVGQWHAILHTKSELLSVV